MDVCDVSLVVCVCDKVLKNMVDLIDGRVLIKDFLLKNFGYVFVVLIIFFCFLFVIGFDCCFKEVINYLYILKFFV